MRSRKVLPDKFKSFMLWGLSVRFSALSAVPLGALYTLTEVLAASLSLMTHLDLERKPVGWLFLGDFCSPYLTV